MLKEWSKRNNNTPNQVDVLSNVHVLWECTNCHGEYSCSLFEKQIGLVHFVQIEKTSGF